MNRMKTLGIALGAVATSLTTTPVALAWPTCSHPAGTGASTPDAETAVQRVIREHLILRRDLAAGRGDNQEDPDGIDRRKADDSYGPPRIREGLVLPEQPRWRM